MMQQSLVRAILALDSLPAGVAILLSILFIILGGGLLFLLYRGIRRERNRYISEKLKVNAMDKAAFDEMLSRRFRVAKKNSHFSIMLIKIREGAELFRSLGEKQYDALLAEFEDRLYAILPKATKICGYEEDLLAIFIDEDLDRKSASDLAAFVLTEAKKPITLVTKVKVTVEISIGMAIFDFSQKLTAEQFFANARHALMSAEDAGPYKYMLHSPEADFADEEEVKYYRDIKKAIQNGEFVLSYQPIMGMNGELVAYESFLRWNHKEYGLLKANRFLPMLVQSGDIQRIGMDAFTQLCLAANRYHQKNPATESTDPQTGAETPASHVLFSMNFSTRQMLLPTFCDDLYRVIKRHHMEVTDFCIEVSDFKTPAVVENIKKLRERGFHVAVDGFNMEGSADTLGELQELSPEWIKLPINFILQSKENFFARGMVDMLVRFSESGSVKIIATGVETQEEADYAKELHIGYGQGAFFAQEVDQI